MQSKARKRKAGDSNLLMTSQTALYLEEDEEERRKKRKESRESNDGSIRE